MVHSIDQFHGKDEVSGSTPDRGSSVFVFNESLICYYAVVYFLMMTNFFALVFFFSILCLPVGLINPSLFQRVIKKILGRDATRENVTGSALSLIFVSLVGVGLTAPVPVVNNEIVNQVTESPEGLPPVVGTEPVLERSIEENSITNTGLVDKTDVVEPEKTVDVVQPETSHLL